jgi:hypothetical protein
VDDAPDIAEHDVVAPGDLAQSGDERDAGSVGLVHAARELLFDGAAVKRVGERLDQGLRLTQ